MTASMAADDPTVLVAPLKRKGTAQEVADAVLFLCSSKATFIQGVALVSSLLAASKVSLADELILTKSCSQSTGATLLYSHLAGSDNSLKEAQAAFEGGQRCPIVGCYDIHLHLCP